jgi:hypothetical protein
LLAVAALLTASGVGRPQDQGGHETAVATVKKAGGKVEVLPDRPGRLVAVILAGSQSPADAMPCLKDVVNLCHLDL